MADSLFSIFWKLTRNTLWLCYLSLSRLSLFYYDKTRIQQRSTLKRKHDATFISYPACAYVREVIAQRGRTKSWAALAEPLLLLQLLLLRMLMPYCFHAVLSIVILLPLDAVPAACSYSPIITALVVLWAPWIDYLCSLLAFWLLHVHVCASSWISCWWIWCDVKGTFALTGTAAVNIVYTSENEGGVTW